MLNLADANPFILGVVGWVDMKADAAASQIARLARHPRFRGLRPMLQSIAEDDWISDPALDPAVAALIEHRLVFDALALPRHLRRVADFARRHPALPVIIDHGAKPLIASGRFSGWRADMAALAALPNVVCKLSGLLVEKGEQRPEAIRPYAETIFDLFGPERVIWGSDWPVVNLAADYGSWLAMCLDIVPAEHHKAVFAENAIRFYRLQLP
jgi:L-fuconolactonase